MRAKGCLSNRAAGFLKDAQPPGRARPGQDAVLLNH